MIAGGVYRSLVMQQWVLIWVNNTTEAYATQVNISDGITQIMHADATAQMMVIIHGLIQMMAMTTLEEFTYLQVVKLRNNYYHEPR